MRRRREAKGTSIMINRPDYSIKPAITLSCPKGKTIKKENWI